MAPLAVATVSWGASALGDCNVFGGSCGERDSYRIPALSAAIGAAGFLASSIYGFARIAVDERACRANMALPDAAKAAK